MAMESLIYILLDSGSVSSKNGGDRPIYVIFMPDQLRYDSLGCTTNGRAGIKTPSIDSFRHRATLFTNCFAQASVCSQSRCSMFTGCYPHVSGHRLLGNLIKPGDTFAPTVTELSVTEYDFLETPSLRSTNEALDYDEAVVWSAMEWLECPISDKPWVEEPFFSMYDRSQITWVISKPEKKTGYEPRYMKFIRESYGTDRATGDMWREIKAIYYGMITRLDDQFGRILAKLDDLGLWKDTVTMFFTDHGEYLGDHGLIEKLPFGLSEALVREPLIIGGAGLPEGNTVNAMAEMADLFLKSEEPLLEQAPYPYDIKASLQHGDTTLVDKAISLGVERYAYIYRLYEPAELYDRAADPHEMHNLASESGGFLPWQKDNRFPQVNLKNPKEQMEERLRMAG
ncbi:alkaline-phosphatase-like protein [Aspergillus navahoensis]